MESRELMAGCGWGLRGVGDLDRMVTRLRGKAWQEISLFTIWIGMLLGQGLSTMRMGMRRLGRTRMRTERPGTGDDKENEIVL
jgi:hypothetical protein